jgi:leader peptidase (prepilin peptidase) / N-methyltransferase
LSAKEHTLPRVLLEMSGPRKGFVSCFALVAVAACLGRFGFSARGVIDAFVAVVLVVLAAIDLEHRILPNAIVLPAAAIVYVAQLAFFPHHALEWTLASFGCALFFLVTLLAYPAGLGMGDVKLGLLLGAALGKSVVAALLLGLFGAALCGLVLLVAQGAAARKKAIPLGPFLAAAALVVLLFG